MSSTPLLSRSSASRGLQPSSGRERSRAAYTRSHSARLQVCAALNREWDAILEAGQHDEQVAQMGEIIREFGLNEIALGKAMTRALGVERVEAAGEGYRLVNNDTVQETRAMPENSVDLIVTSIPWLSASRSVGR